MPTDKTARTARLMLTEVWSRGDLALIDAITTPDYRVHVPTQPTPIEGRQALKAAVTTFRRGIPDLTKTIDATHIDGDTVLLRYTVTGTHDGPILGVPATGHSIEIPGVYIANVGADRLTHARDLWDVYGLLAQLDALPTHLAPSIAHHQQNDTK